MIDDTNLFVLATRQPDDRIRDNTFSSFARKTILWAVYILILDER